MVKVAVNFSVASNGQGGVGTEVPRTQLLCLYLDEAEGATYALHLRLWLVWEEL